MAGNGKVTIPKLYEEIMPIKETVIEIKTLLTTHLKRYDEDCKENNDTHNKLEKKIYAKTEGKISIKAFATWLSITTVIITTIVTVIVRVIGG